MPGGFHYDSQRLADLTGNALPAWFYSEDAFGSFNSWARIISGVLFAFGVVWFAFPYLERSLHEAATILRVKLAKVNATAFER